MSEAKLNKDKLLGGSLVSEEDHLRIMTEKRKQAKAKAKAAAEAAAKAASKQ